MLPEVAADARAKGLFLREMRNARALKHPHIVNLHESGCSRGTFFCTLEFCDGGSADKLMKSRGGKLPLGEAAAIVLQALEGLAYARSALFSPFTMLARIGPGGSTFRRRRNMRIGGSG
jgi:serine/threonine protein kinase